MNVIGHVSRKMTSVIFAVLRDDQPYRPALPNAGYPNHTFQVASTEAWFIVPFFRYTAIHTKCKFTP